MMTIAEPDTATAVPSHSAEKLYEDLLSGRRTFILDVRNQKEFERWRVEGGSSLQVKNVPYFSFIENEEESVAQVPPDEDVLVVCAKEGSAEFVADILRQNGITASYLEEGILSWGNLYDVRDVVDEPYGRIIQVARPARGDLSFVVISDGQAAIVDPLRHVDHYLNVVHEAGARVTHIFDTHAHADHISGGPDLHRATGAPYYMHPYDAIHPLDMLPGAIDYAYLRDGQTFRVGQFTVRVIWFPGHTLGQVNYLFTAPAEKSLITAPTGQRYLFSGDGIFLRSFGRPDLGGQAEAWTPILYESLYERLPPHLDDDTVILPAHFSSLDEGTASGASAAGVFAAPYSQVKQQNRGLRSRSPEEFTEYVLGNLPTFPEEYVEIKRVNAGLVQPTEEEAEELELGKNICALADA